MQKTMYKILYLLLVIILATGIASAQDTDITLQLDWIDTIEYSGFYIGEQVGYYAEAGLNVELRPGGFDADGNYITSIAEVVSGNADFGLTSGDDLLMAHAEGLPVIAIGVIYQRSPDVLMSLVENDITTPQDLIGKTVSVSAPGIKVFALLNVLDIDPDEVNVVFREDFTNDTMLNGDVDVLDAFVTNQPVQLRLEEHDLNLIFLSDYAVDIYSNVIFTTETMIEENPELVEDFLTASLLGLQGAVDDPEYAANLTFEIVGNEGPSLEFHTQSMLRSIPLINPRDTQLGMMNSIDWEFTWEVLVFEDLLDEEVDFEDAFTMEFLDAIYGNYE